MERKKRGEGSRERERERGGGVREREMRRVCEREIDGGVMWVRERGRLLKRERVRERGVRERNS